MNIRRELTRCLKNYIPNLQQQSTTAAMTDTDEIIRCSCGSAEQLPLSKPGKEAWIRCDICETWQHPICVGLLDDKNLMPEEYFCEECKPEYHHRFQFGSGPDNRAHIAEERQAMHVMQRTRNDAERRKKTMWLVDEIMAIVKAQPKTMNGHWRTLSGLPAKPLDEEDFHEKMLLSIRIVLNNATVTALEGFRARLVKIRFSGMEVVAAELWTLKTWLVPQFMTRMESVTGKEWLEAKFEMQGLDSMGQANAKVVRKYFNL